MLTIPDLRLLNRLMLTTRKHNMKPFKATTVYHSRTTVESKAVPLHDMVAIGGREVIAPTHSWPRHYMGWVVSVTPRGKDPVPTVQEAGWAPEPVWTQSLEEKSFAPAGDRTPITLSSSP
jgi:hypothetical protein